MLICSKCGQTSPNGTRYCPNCGASLGTQRKAGCLSGIVVVILIFVIVGMMLAMCSPKESEPSPAQTTKAAEPARTTNKPSTEAKISSDRPQKDGFDNKTNKTIVIGSYQIKVPSYFKNGSYSNAKKTYDAEAESGEQSVSFYIDLMPGSYSYDSLNANKETIFNKLKNSMHNSGVENSGVRFNDYNSKLGKGIVAEYVSTITSNGSRAYIRYVLIPVKDGCLVFHLLQSNQSKWIYTNDFEKIINSAEVKPASKKKNTAKKSTNKKSSKKTTKKRK